MNTVDNQYSTKDAEKAELLYASGQVINSYNWVGNTCYFQFNDKEGCTNILTQDLKGELTLNSRSYLEGRRTIRSILRSR